MGAALMFSLTANGASAAPTPKPKATPVVKCAATPGVDASSISLGYMMPRTGPAAPTFAGADKAAQLRIDQENAKGGINGRKIRLTVYDDMASGGQQTVQAQKAVGENIFGLLSTSSTDAMFAYLKSQNIPVTGFNANAMSTDRNAFSATGVVSPLYTSTANMERLKLNGVTKVANINHASPSAASSSNGWSKAMDASGLTEVLRIADEQVGAHDATSTALRIRNSGADGVIANMYVDGAISVAQGLKAQNVTPKGVIVAGLVDPAYIAKANGTLDGSIGSTYGAVPPGINKPAVRTFINGMKAGGLNPYGAIAPVGYLSADLMIKGLKLAGKCPTRANFITNLRALKSYDGNGLLPEKISFAPGITPNGTPVKCSWFVVVKNGALVPDAKPTCGSIVETATGKVVA